MSEGIAALEDVPLWRRVLARLWRLLPGRLRGYLAVRFRGVSSSEAWGYAVWGAAGLVIGVPEIWAAAAGSDFVWPTISTTVGHLQDRWPVVALIPVAFIVMSAYSVLRVGPVGESVQADLRAIGRTDEGRLKRPEGPTDQYAPGGTLVVTEREALPVRWYFVVATAVVVAGALLAVPSDNRFLVGYVLYALIGVFWVVIPNLAAYFYRRDIGFTTMYLTVRNLARRMQFVAFVVAALLVILLLHLAFYPWPSRP